MESAPHPAKSQHYELELYPRDCQNITDKAPMGIGKFSPEGKIIYANQTLATMLGFSSVQEFRSAVDHEEIFAFIVPGVWGEAKEALCRQGRLVNFEHQVHSRGRSDLWLSTNAHVVQDEHGAVDHYLCFCIDITKSKKTELELRESEERFRLVLNSLPGGVFTNDLEGRILFVNDMACQNTGYSRDELLQMKVSDIDPQSLVRDDQSELWNSLELGQSVTLESIHVRKDGTTYPAEIHLTAISSGQELHILSFAFDITQRKEVEESLRKSKELFLSLAEQCPVSIMYFDRQGVVTFVNDWHIQRFAASKLEKSFFLGKRVFDLPGLVRAGVGDDIQRILDGERIELNDVYFPRFAGGYSGWVNIRGVPITLHGQVAGGMLVREDVTERKNNEFALCRREQRLNHFLTVSPVILYELSLQSLEITWVGPNVSSLLGYSPEEVMQPGWWSDHIYAQDKDQAMQNIQFIYETGHVIQEYRFWTKQGSVVWIEDNTRLLHGECGTWKEIVGAWTEITERKMYEQRLQYVSLHDPLTELYNRAYFQNELRRLDQSREYPISLLSMDLDGMKLINDTMGHQAGDAHLRACAAIFRTSFRSSDLIFRIGGDEFAALLPNTDQPAGEQIVSRLRKNIQDRNENVDQDMPISLSIGLACAQAGSEKLEELFNQADERMYQDKREKQDRTRQQFVQAAMRMLQLKDCLAQGHGKRVKSLCMQLGHRLQLSSEQLSNLEKLSHIHDVGLIGVPDKILFKSGPLNEDEWEVIRQHPEKGSYIAQVSKQMRPLAEFILTHHERWDGQGYPLGLKGRKIRVECRIMAIADAFDVMTSDRPFGQTRSIQAALEEIHRCSGTQFDPDLVSLFLEILGFDTGHARG